MLMRKIGLSRRCKQKLHGYHPSMALRSWMLWFCCILGRNVWMCRLSGVQNLKWKQSWHAQQSVHIKSETSSTSKAARGNVRYTYWTVFQDSKSLLFWCLITEIHTSAEIWWKKLMCFSIDLFTHVFSPTAQKLYMTSIVLTFEHDPRTVMG